MKITLPALSPTMETGNLVKWLVKENDVVISGQVLAEIETDKATMELESPDDGIISKIIIPENTENIKVNSEIAILKIDGEEEDELNTTEANNKNIETEVANKEPTIEIKPVMNEVKINFSDGTDSDLSLIHI